MGTSCSQDDGQRVTEYVVVAVGGKSARAIGPFADADDARDYVNSLALGIPEILWNVVPLQEPS